MQVLSSKYYRVFSLMYVFCMSSSAVAVDFHYEFENVFSPNADQYLIRQTNMVKAYEPNYGISYWCPSLNTGQGEIIYRFDFPVVSNDIALKFRLTAFNIDAFSGNASIFGSTDGALYNLITSISTPSSSSNDVFYNAFLGSEFLGQDKFFLKVQLNVVNAYQMAQFLRSNDQPQIFSITENSAIVVPEPSGLILLLIAILMYFTTSTKSLLLRRWLRFY